MWFRPFKVQKPRQGDFLKTVGYELGVNTPGAPKPGLVFAPGRNKVTLGNIQGVGLE